MGTLSKSTKESSSGNHTQGRIFMLEGADSRIRDFFLFCSGLFQYNGEKKES